MNNILCYDLSDLLKPKLIKKYNLISDIETNVEYKYHGMVCKDIKIKKLKKKYNYDNNNKPNNYKRYDLKILLFGGSDNGFKIKPSSIELSINYKYNNITDNNNFDSINIKDKSITLNSKTIKSRNWYQFGYVSFLNTKEERIILIVGGLRSSKSVFLYNTTTNEINTAKDVRCILCLFIFIYLIIKFTQ